MSKENNDAMEQNREDAQVIENDDVSKDNNVSEENGVSKDEDTAKEHEASEEHDDSKGSDDSKDAEKPSNSPKLLIVEIVIAIAAIAFIIFALISNNKNNDSVSGNYAASGNTASDISGNTVSGPEPAAIDNSALYENIPAIPDIAELNQMTEEEAEAAVADETMLKYTLADGASLYIGNYTNQTYFEESTSVSESDIDDFITENILPDFGELSETDHTAVAEGDVVSANFLGKLDGVAFEGGTAENVTITVGAGGYIPGFEEGFIGMAAGESKDVSVTFPENYKNAELAGKDVVFTLTVNEIIGTMTYPDELTDEMVQQIFYDGSYTTVAECRDLIREIMTENNVWTFVTENYYITSISEEPVYQYYNAEMASQERTAAQYQMSVEEMLSYMGQPLDGLKQDAIMNACYTTILYSICEQIATDNSITVSDEDIAAFATEYGYPDTQTLFTAIDEKTVREYLLQDKVLNYLVSLLP